MIYPRNSKGQTFSEWLESNRSLINKGATIMKEIGYNVKCTKGNIIKLHDVCRSVSTNEIVIVGEGVNKVHETKGLVADNEVTGAGDWLSVYPDGELEVLCNLTDGASELNEQKPYYYEIGTPVLVYWEGEWQEGKITNGYRTHDGVINIQLLNGRDIWFGEARHEEYIKPIDSGSTSVLQEIPTANNLSDLNAEQLEELEKDIDDFITAKAGVENFIARHNLDEDEVWAKVDEDYEEAMSRQHG